MREEQTLLQQDVGGVEMNLPDGSRKKDDARARAQQLPATITVHFLRLGTGLVPTQKRDKDIFRGGFYR